MNITIKSNQTVWALGIVGAVCVLMVIHLAAIDPATRAVIGLELAKLLLNILVIVILGGVVKHLLDDFENRRRKAEAENAFRKAFLDRVIAAYMEAKRVRRELRSLLPFEKANTAGQMAALNDAELDLEIIENEVKSSAKVFPDPEGLARNIKSMADYLRDVTAESENKKSDADRDRSHAETATIASAESNLQDFIGPYQQSRFRTQFVHPYRAVIEMVRSDILKGS